MWSYSVLPKALPSKHCHQWRGKDSVFKARRMIPFCKESFIQHEVWLRRAQPYHIDWRPKDINQEALMVSWSKCLITFRRIMCSHSHRLPWIWFKICEEGWWPPWMLMRGVPGVNIGCWHPCCPWCYIKWRSSTEGWGSMQGSPHRTHVQGPTADHHSPEHWACPACWLG